MSQTIDSKLFEEFETEMKTELNKVKRKSIIQNSSPPTTTWMQKVTAKVRISELASELGVDFCPMIDCGYPISFDDSKGWFICLRAKYNHDCDFQGNIVNFMERCG